MSSDPHHSLLDGQTCPSDDYCASGSCKNNICVHPCGSNIDCKQTELCGDTGICVLLPPANSVPVGGKCRSDECKSGTCLNGVCVATKCGSNDKLCQADEFCGDDEVCVALPSKGSIKIGSRCPLGGDSYCESGFCSNGTCTDPAGKSKCNPPCVTGQFCDVQSNTCKTICNNNTCLPPKKCSNSLCVDCTGNSDCSGKKCAGNGTCVECLIKDDCKTAGQVCSNNSCVSSGSLPDCQKPEDCKSGVCTAGKCVVPNNKCNFDINCGEDETCKSGICVKTVCSPACDSTKKCVRGQCVDDDNIFKQYWWAFAIGGAVLFLIIIIIMIVMKRRSSQQFYY